MFGLFKRKAPKAPSAPVVHAPAGPTRAAFYDAIRPFFGKLSADQVRGMDGLIDAFHQVGDGKADTLAYGLSLIHI